MKENKTNYETPQVEVIEVQVEQGFAVSEQDGSTTNFRESDETPW